MTMGDKDLDPEVQVAGSSPQASGTWLSWGPAVLCRDLPISQGVDRVCIWPQIPSWDQLVEWEFTTERPQGYSAPGT